MHKRDTYSTNEIAIFVQSGAWRITPPTAISPNQITRQSRPTLRLLSLTSTI